MLVFSTPQSNPLKDFRSRRTGRILDWDSLLAKPNTSNTTRWISPRDGQGIRGDAHQKSIPERTKSTKSEQLIRQPSIEFLTAEYQRIC